MHRSRRREWRRGRDGSAGHRHLRCGQGGHRARPPARGIRLRRAHRRLAAPDGARPARVGRRPRRSRGHARRPRRRRGRHHRRRAVRQGRHGAVGGLRRTHRRRRHELLAAGRRPHRRDRRRPALDERDQRRPQPARPRREVAQPPRLPRDGGRRDGRGVPAAPRARRRRRRRRRPRGRSRGSSTTSASTRSTADRSPTAAPSSPATRRSDGSCRPRNSPRCSRRPHTSPPDAAPPAPTLRRPARCAPCCPTGRGTRSRAGPRLVDGLLEHLGAGCPHLLEGGVEVVGAEDEHRQHALGEQLLHGVAVGLGRPACGSESTMPRPGWASLPSVTQR